MIIGKYLHTTVGSLYLAVENGCVVRLTGGKAEKEDVVVSDSGDSERVRFEKNADSGTEPAKSDLELLEHAVREVEEYMAGTRRDFQIPTRVSGTAFQEKVWKALGEIPYGETRTYGEIASAVGSPKGARAVGMACNRNPIMLFIPCHRVIGSTGKLVGFGGGLPMKEYLLGLEKGKININIGSTGLDRAKCE